MPLRSRAGLCEAKPGIARARPVAQAAGLPDRGFPNPPRLRKAKASRLEIGDTTG